MKRAALLRAEHYRDMATRFLLDDAEPLHGLRQHLRRMAAEHDVMASELDAALCIDAGAVKDLATEPQRECVRSRGVKKTTCPTRSAAIVQLRAPASER